MNTALLIVGQVIVYLCLLLAAPYAGSLLALIIGVICLACWIIAHIVERVEPSKVPSSFYGYLLSGWLAPFTAVLLFAILRGGLDWN